MGAYHGGLLTAFGCCPSLMSTCHMAQLELGGIVLRTRGGNWHTIPNTLLQIHRDNVVYT